MKFLLQISKNLCQILFCMQTKAFCMQRDLLWALLLNDKLRKADTWQPSSLLYLCICLFPRSVPADQLDTDHSNQERKYLSILNVFLHQSGSVRQGPIPSPRWQPRCRAFCAVECWLVSCPNSGLQSALGKSCFGSCLTLIGDSSYISQDPIPITGVWTIIHWFWPAIWHLHCPFTFCCYILIIH